MGSDARQQTLQRYVTDVLALESELEAAVDGQRATARGHGDVAATLERFHAMIRGHREALQTYSDTGGGRRITPEPSPVASLFEARAAVSEERGVTDLLRADYAAFNYAAISYAVLFELALRLYEPPLRELAPKHLRGYAEAAQTINQLVARAAVEELTAVGLDCECICPMCGIGACGCVALGAATSNQAWRETSPDEDAARGFALEAPRSSSQLAVAGVQGGDRLLEVDGTQVHAIPQIQAAIRKHTIGDEVRLVIQRGSDAPREIRVEHVSDYPQT